MADNRTDQELRADFKSHKWTNDVEFAEQSYALYREVLIAMGADLPEVASV